jgi:hypothetical protein
MESGGVVRQAHHEREGNGLTTSGSEIPLALSLSKGEFKQGCGSSCFS